MAAPPSPLLVVISGPSGVGKDAVLARMQRLPGTRHFVVTATTRPKRHGETDGVDYIFMEQPDFRALLERDGFLEHAEVYGRSYGVPRSQVDEPWQAGKDVILKTDVQGSRTLKNKVPDALLIFLAPPDLEELERRLRQRKSETTEDLNRRIATAKQEMECEPEFDHVVVNHSGQLDGTVAAIEQIIKQEKVRRARV